MQKFIAVRFDFMQQKLCTEQILVSKKIYCYLYDAKKNIFFLISSWKMHPVVFCVKKYQNGAYENQVPV
jgi:hypothetical protein